MNWGCTGFLFWQILNRPFFENLAKSGSCQIPSRIWWMPLQLHYVQLIVDKTNATDLSSGVFAILISVNRSKKIYKIHLPFHKFLEKLANSDLPKEALKLYCLFIAVLLLLHC